MTYQDVLSYVEQIKNLLQKKEELKKTIESRDFPRAIQMCLDAQGTAHMYAQFNCVAGMRKVIQVISPCIVVRAGTFILTTVM